MALAAAAPTLRALIARITDIEPGTYNFTLCETFATANVQRHKFMDIDEQRTSEGLWALVEKEQIHAKFARARDLERLATGFDTILSRSSLPVSVKRNVAGIVCILMELESTADPRLTRPDDALPAPAVAAEEYVYEPPSDADSFSTAASSDDDDWLSDAEDATAAKSSAEHGHVQDMSALPLYDRGAYEHSASAQHQMEASRDAQYWPQALRPFGAPLSEWDAMREAVLQLQSGASLLFAASPSGDISVHRGAAFADVSPDVAHASLSRVCPAARAAARIERFCGWHRGSDNAVMSALVAAVAETLRSCRGDGLGPIERALVEQERMAAEVPPPPAQRLHDFVDRIVGAMSTTVAFAAVIDRMEGRVAPNAAAHEQARVVVDVLLDQLEAEHAADDRLRFDAVARALLDCLAAYLSELESWLAGRGSRAVPLHLSAASPSLRTSASIREMVSVRGAFPACMSASATSWMEAGRSCALLTRLSREAVHRSLAPFLLPRRLVDALGDGAAAVDALWRAPAPTVLLTAALTTIASDAAAAVGVPMANLLASHTSVRGAIAALRSVFLMTSPTMGAFAAEVFSLLDAAGGDAKRVPNLTLRFREHFSGELGEFADRCLAEIVPAGDLAGTASDAYYGRINVIMDVPWPGALIVDDARLAVEYRGAQAVLLAMSGARRGLDAMTVARGQKNAATLTRYKARFDMLATIVALQEFYSVGVVRPLCAQADAAFGEAANAHDFFRVHEAFVASISERFMLGASQHAAHAALTAMLGVCRRFGDACARENMDNDDDVMGKYGAFREHRGQLVAQVQLLSDTTGREHWKSLADVLSSDISI